MKCGRWAERFSKCIECGTVRTPHQAKGLCYNCYHRIKGLNGIWAKENPKLARRCRDFWDLTHKKYRLKKAKERYYRLKKQNPNYSTQEKERVKLYRLRKSDRFLVEDVENLVKKLKMMNVYNH